MELFAGEGSWHENSLRKRCAWHGKRGLDKVGGSLVFVGCSCGDDTIGYVFVRSELSWYWPGGVVWW